MPQNHLSAACRRCGRDNQEQCWADLKRVEQDSTASEQVLTHSYPWRRLRYAQIFHYSLHSHRYPSIPGLHSMTRYGHTLQIILMKTGWREKANLPPQSSLLYKINFWIDYINVIHISLHSWKLKEVMWGSEVHGRAALLQKGRDISPHHDALNILLSLYPFFPGRDHLIPMITPCMVGWFSSPPRELWSIQPCLRSSLHQFWVEKTQK